MRILKPLGWIVLAALVLLVLILLISTTHAHLPAP